MSTFRTCLERLSFYLWIAFTIFAISLAGVGIEGMGFACYLLMVSSTQPIHFPLAMVSAGAFGVSLSIFWRQVGIDHLHYLQHDSVISSEGEDEAPDRVLRNLIHEVESSAGYARTEARAKAKAWLISHACSLDKEDILLVKTHLGYLLPAEWGT
jgi:hypothetical protein